MRRFLFLIACMAMNLQLFSQELTEFKGRVIDAATGNACGRCQGTGL